MTAKNKSESVHIPDKLYFKIGEVSEIVGVKPYVLRYWETEFKSISPVKSKTNQRIYKKKDVELLLKIKTLLYSERFTIKGARSRLKSVHEERPDPQLGLALDQAPVLPSQGLVSAYLKSLLDEMQTTLRD